MLNSKIGQMLLAIIALAVVVIVLMLAAGAGWESRAIAVLDGDRGVTLLKRCVDLDDLLAAATSGQADVAVIDLDAPGLDPAAVVHLRRYGVRPVAVAARAVDAVEHASRLDIAVTVPADDLDGLAGAVTSAEDLADTSVRTHQTGGGIGGEIGGATVDSIGADLEDPEGAGGRHRVIVVWGPGGAPGRTTVAVNLAAELGHRGRPTVLVDADPWGGAVAQHLGILDEVSGLLSAARLAAAGQLRERFTSTCRAVDGQLMVVTGLPRAERWREVRSSHLEQLLELGAARADVVVDTGFTLEDDPAADFGGRPARNGLTTAALGCADEVVVVGAADPVGLARLARGLAELREHDLSVPIRVVVNRMRSSLGWSESEVAGLVEGFVGVAGLHYLPDDRAAADQALVTGRALVETRDSALTRGLSSLADALVPESAGTGAPRARLRRGRR